MSNEVLKNYKYYASLVVHSEAEKFFESQGYSICQPPALSPNGSSAFDFLALKSNEVRIVECKVRKSFFCVGGDADRKEISFNKEEWDRFYYFNPENSPVKFSLPERIIFVGNSRNRTVHFATAQELVSFENRGTKYPFECTADDGIRYIAFSAKQFFKAQLSEDALSEIQRIYSQETANIKEEFIPKTLAQVTIDEIRQNHLFVPEENTPDERKKITIADDRLIELTDVSNKRSSSIRGVGFWQNSNTGDWIIPTFDIAKCFGTKISMSFSADIDYRPATIEQIIIENKNILIFRSITVLSQNHYYIKVSDAINVLNEFIRRKKNSREIRYKKFVAETRKNLPILKKELEILQSGGELEPVTYQTPLAAESELVASQDEVKNNSSELSTFRSQMHEFNVVFQKRLKEFLSYGFSNENAEIATLRFMANHVLDFDAEEFIETFILK